MSKPDVAWASSPTPGTAVDVEFALVVKAIQTIDAQRGTAAVIIEVVVHWTDPRVATACAHDPRWKPPAQMWVPGINIGNGIGDSQFMTRNEPGHRVRITDRAQGKLRAVHMFAGEVDNPMALEGFPFDEDSLDFRFNGCQLCSGEAAGADDFVLRAKGGDSFVTFFFDINLPEYEILGVSYVQYCQWGESNITAGISLRRKHEYYFYKVTILMWLIVLLSMPTFMYGFDELEQRVSLVSTMFLATAATLYVVGQDLPKTNHLNRMDKLLLGTLGIIFGAGAESIAVSLMHTEHPDDAETLENFAAFALPVLYLLLNTALFLAPMLRQKLRGATPAEKRKERTYIAWKDVTKVDPWGVDVNAAEVKVTTASGNPARGAALSAGRRSQKRQEKRVV
jgi:hypothetical protein